MVVGPDTREQRVTPYALGGVRGEAADLYGVGERPWRPTQQLLQERVAGVGELEELHGRQDVEGILHQWEEDHREHQGEEAVHEPDPAVLHGYPQALAPDQGYREGHYPRDEGDEQPRPQELHPGPGAQDRVDREPRYQEQSRGQEKVVAGDNADVHAGDDDHEKHQARSQKDGA